jgi:hypothetical protein
MELLSKPYWSFLVMALVFTSCERSIDTAGKSSGIYPASANKAATSKCRLTYSNYVDGFSTEFYEYNEEGLVKKVKNDYFGGVYIYATMQYDSKGRIITGTASYDDITYYDMAFEYENNRIVREITYEPGTSNIIDLATNTYNNKGQIIRREDAIYDLYTEFEYDSEGNNIVSDLKYLSSDYLVVRIVFHYDQHVKSPFTARPGVPHNWWYINEVTSPLVPTERDEYWGDGAGGEFLAFDEDPAKTVINPTAQNFAGDRLIFDNIFGVENYQYWEYENCGGKNELNSRSSKSIGKMDPRSKDIALLKMPLLRGPVSKQQLAERKAILQRLKN